MRFFVPAFWTGDLGITLIGCVIGCGRIVSHIISHAVSRLIIDHTGGEKHPCQDEYNQIKYEFSVMHNFCFPFGFGLTYYE